ncbi:hypothetical protein B7494_g7017 [Chlorociboria aeruginascens]|nr:hypothetical protein B7494_g7017 [Chlorociboria aeruginascens]
MSYRDQSGGGGYPPPPLDPRDPRDPREQQDQRDQQDARDARGQVSPHQQIEPQYPPLLGDARYPPPPGDSRYPPLGDPHYPPPPGESERGRTYHQRTPSSGGNATLPPMATYDSQYAQPNGYSPDPRAYPQPDPYRSPPQPGPFRDDRVYQVDYARAPPQQQMSFSQSAPRQRTAIACRYCRRRKIRCSGFENNPEGRCSNCQRFQQDCIFTPVSSQAQAFVPAHAVYPGMRNMAVGPDGRPRPMFPQNTQLYGAHGQPLGSIPVQVNAQGGSPYNDYAVPSPTSSYNSFSEDRDRASQSQVQGQLHAQEQSRKRPQEDPHASILPPPIPGQPPFKRSDSSGRRHAAEDDLRLPPVTPTNGAHSASNYSPASSTSSNSNLQPQQSASLPTRGRTTPPRTSPADGRSDPMAIGNIMERRPDTEIDRNMLGRLDRKGQ